MLRYGGAVADIYVAVIINFSDFCADVIAAVAEI